jgi:hypothetical protein
MTGMIWIAVTPRSCKYCILGMTEANVPGLVAVDPLKVPICIS